MTTLVVALFQPYMKAYMNYLDALLLSFFTVQSFTLSLHSTLPTVHLVVRVLLVIPFAVIVLYVIWRRFKCLVTNCNLRRAPPDIEAAPTSMLDTASTSRSILQPASTRLGYGTM